MTSEAASPEDTVLILAPFGRDASLAASVLEQAGMSTVVCRDGADLVERVDRAAGAAVVAEEALKPSVVRGLGEVLAQQQPWSDFPFLIFTERTASAAENRRALEGFAELGNITALERPIHPLTMLSAVRAALRARARQYNTRSAFEEREREVHQRDQFLAMLGHELRNPLGAIRNATLFAQRQPGPAAALERPLSTIDRQIRHLTQLVDDLLDVARVTTGKIVLKRAPVDLAALCRGLGAEFKRSSRERLLDLRVETPNRPVIVLADRVRLEQIVNNLLTNALKYTPSGGHVVMTVAAGGKNQAGAAEATLRVADTGVGIAAETLQTIFEPFTQSPGTLDRSQGGMGLGLSVVRALVNLHGGSVTASSAGLGRGAQFDVHFPLALHATVDPDDLTPGPSALSPRVVLIVEDSADNRESLRDLLEDAGHVVHTAVDGFAGVDQAIALHPDIALVDIGLPRLDGFEVARRLRAHYGGGIFLVALTGYGQPEDRTRAIAAGFDVHLVKPIDINALDRILAGVASGASVSTAGA